MLFPKFGTCKSAYKGNRCLDSCVLKPFYAFDELLSGLTLVYHVENLLASGFRSHIYHFQTVSAKFFKLFPALSQNVRRASVGCYSFTLWKILFDILKNRKQLMVCKAKRIAVTEENSLNSAVLLSCPRKILEYFLRFSYFELLRLEHIAKCAFVM